ncbi:hypothetical protein BC828DRAFT_397017 [Blastocladiella britannica]|nr:hypothetical protein BC828DRAFT_397017 [Blastocladiella britannica]
MGNPLPTSASRRARLRRSDATRLSPLALRFPLRPPPATSAVPTHNPLHSPASPSSHHPAASHAGCPCCSGGSGSGLGGGLLAANLARLRRTRRPLHRALPYPSANSHAAAADAAAIALNYMQAHPRVPPSPPPPHSPASTASPTDSLGYFGFGVVVTDGDDDDDDDDDDLEEDVEVNDRAAGQSDDDDGIEGDDCDAAGIPTGGRRVYSAAAMPPGQARYLHRRRRRATNAAAAAAWSRSSSDTEHDDDPLGPTLRAARTHAAAVAARSASPHTSPHLHSRSLSPPPPLPSIPIAFATAVTASSSSSSSSTSFAVPPLPTRPTRSMTAAAALSLPTYDPTRPMRDSAVSAARAARMHSALAAAATPMAPSGGGRGSRPAPGRVGRAWRADPFHLESGSGRMPNDQPPRNAYSSSNSSNHRLPSGLPLGPAVPAEWRSYIASTATFPPPSSLPSSSPEDEPTNYFFDGSTGSGVGSIFGRHLPYLLPSGANVTTPTTRPRPNPHHPPIVHQSIAVPPTANAAFAAMGGANRMYPSYIPPTYGLDFPPTPRAFYIDRRRAVSGSSGRGAAANGELNAAPTTTAQQLTRSVDPTEDDAFDSLDWDRLV